eukprot:13448495-Alexandrium_andersonii.AAC.1
MSAAEVNLLTRMVLARATPLGRQPFVCFNSEGALAGDDADFDALTRWSVMGLVCVAGSDPEI